MEKITEELAELEMHSAVRNAIRLLDRIKDYEKRVLKHSGALCREDHEALRDALGLMARVIMPFAPHVGEELWESSGLGEPGVDPPWPRAGEWSRQPPAAAGLARRAGAGGGGRGVDGRCSAAERPAPAERNSHDCGGGACDARPSGASGDTDQLCGNSPNMTISPTASSAMMC